MADQTPPPDQIEEWMRDVANKRKPRMSLIYNPKTRRLEMMRPGTDNPDENQVFTAEEATRFERRS
jgi:hypothetical protein